MLTKLKSDYFITLAEAKAHLRVDTNSEDALIIQLIKTAVSFAENYINKDIALTANTLVLKNFIGCKVEIDESNLIAITSVKDALGVDIIYNDLCVYDSWFEFDIPQSLPMQDISIVFQTGFPDSNSLPHAIRQAILIKLTDFYDYERSSYNFNTVTAGKVFENLLNYYVCKKVKYINYNNDIY